MLIQVENMFFSHPKPHIGVLVPDFDTAYQKHVHGHSCHTFSLTHFMDTIYNHTIHSVEAMMYI